MEVPDIIYLPDMGNQPNLTKDMFVVRTGRYFRLAMKLAWGVGVARGLFSGLKKKGSFGKGVFSETSIF